MGFYYFSIFSIVPLGIAYGMLFLVYWGIARLTRGIPGRKALLVVVGMVFLILPVAEELWIAWNFGQACKEAGTVITKRVNVDGFYDDTTHWWRQLSEFKYQFVESRDNLYGTLWRVERFGNEIRHFEIERPTARYHYKWPNSHTRVSHKIVKHERIVADSFENQILAREVAFGRDASWFYIGLDRPLKPCNGKRELKGSLFVNVLFPKDAEELRDKR